MSVWQVQAAVLALVVAAVLFAFESALRQRPGTPLHEYASRAGLAQFVYLGAAGLVAVGTVLVWSPQDPPTTAAVAATLVAGVHLAAVPWLASRAMRVIGPDWFRHARLEDVRRGVEAHVHAQALRLAALHHLQEHIPDVDVGLRYFEDGRHVVDSARADGEVYDIRLDRLRDVASTTKEPRITAALGERVRGGDQLLTCAEEPASPSLRCVQLVRAPQGDALERSAKQLFEEGLEAITGSPTALEDIRKAYAELWLSWPRTWAQLGQRVSNNLLRAHDDLFMGPADRIQRDYHKLLEESVRQDRKLQALLLAGLPYDVVPEAVELGAADVVREMTIVLRTLLDMDAPPSLERPLVERGWRGLAELLQYQVLHPMARDETTPDDLDHLADVAGLFFIAIAHSLRALHRRRRDDAFDALDQRFRQVLSHWRADNQLSHARRLLSDPDAFDASPEDLERARHTVRLARMRDDLDRLRRGYRLCVLAWMVDEAVRETDTDVDWGRIRRLATSMGRIPQVVEAVPVVLEDTSPLDTWVTARLPEGQVGVIDTFTPVARAMALILLLHRGPTLRVPPAAWMSEHRIEAVLKAVDEVAAVPAVQQSLRTAEDTPEQVVERVKGALRQAYGRQRQVDADALAQQPLDGEKVQLFTRGVHDAWVAHRPIAALAELTGLQVERDGAMDGPPLGFPKSLEPKGLFVSPSNWAGLEGMAEEFGRKLGQGEVSAVLDLVVARASHIPGGAPNADAVSRILGRAVEAGYEPSLIVTSISWRLADSLGLPLYHEPLVEEGALGPSIAGYFEDVPVLQWWDVPDGRVYVVDLRRFARVREGAGEDLEPRPPTAAVRFIDEERADAIVAHAGPHTDAEQEQALRTQVLTSVELEVHRPFQVQVLDEDAAWYTDVDDPGAAG